MTITVGTDTYITIVEADAYYAATRLAADAQLVAWTALSDGDKEILLRNATRSIDRLKFPGKKNDNDQALSFPRDSAVAQPPRREGYWPGVMWCADDQVPDEIKYAQAEEALELASPSGDTNTWNSARSPLKSFRIGDLSETNRDGPTIGQNSPSTVLRSLTAQEFVAELAGGGFRVL